MTTISSPPQSLILISFLLLQESAECGGRIFSEWTKTVAMIYRPKPIFAQYIQYSVSFINHFH